MISRVARERRVLNKSEKSWNEILEHQRRVIEDEEKMNIKQEKGRKRDSQSSIRILNLLLTLLHFGSHRQVNSFT